MVTRAYQVKTLRRHILCRAWLNALADNRQDLEMHRLSGRFIQKTCSPRAGLSDSPQESLLHICILHGTIVGVV
jgi:hypothetical protein